jgi:hypothetical protein
MQEKAKIFKLLISEIKTYPNPQITPEGLGMIAERLDKKYSYEQVERAMGRLAYKSKFFPSLAEIADEIGGGKPNLTAEGYKVKWVN